MSRRAAGLPGRLVSRGAMSPGCFHPSGSTSLRLTVIRREASWLVLVLAFGAVAPKAGGHDGVDGRIAAVTGRIARRPEDATLRLERAEYHRLQRAWRAAAADLERAAALDPGLAAVHLARARLDVDGCVPARALAALDEFDRREPGRSETWVLRARALAQLGRGADAAGAWDRAVELAERPDPDVHFARARQRFALGGDHRARAIAGLDEGVRRLGGAMQLEELALQLETEQGDLAAALARVERLRAAAPRPELWRARAAELLERAGRRVEALAAVDLALAEIAAAPARMRSGRSSRALFDELQRRRERLSGIEGTRNP